MARKKTKPWIPSGKEIQEQLDCIGMKQTELAIITGLSQQMISAVVNEKKDICTRHMRKIIDALW